MKKLGWQHENRCGKPRKKANHLLKSKKNTNRCISFFKNFAVFAKSLKTYQKLINETISMIFWPFLKLTCNTTSVPDLVQRHKIP